MNTFEEAMMRGVDRERRVALRGSVASWFYSSLVFMCASVAAAGEPTSRPAPANPRIAVEEYVAAVAAGADARAREMGPGAAASLRDMRRLLEGNRDELPIETAAATEMEGLVLSQPIPGDRGRGQVIFDLQRRNGLWLITDLDWGIPEQATQRMKRFYEQYPSAHVVRPAAPAGRGTGR